MLTSKSVTGTSQVIHHKRKQKTTMRNLQPTSCGRGYQFAGASSNRSRACRVHSPLHSGEARGNHDRSRFPSFSTGRHNNLKTETKTLLLRFIHDASLFALSPTFALGAETGQPGKGFNQLKLLTVAGRVPVGTVDS